jgi:hypothetical protein
MVELEILEIDTVDQDFSRCRVRASITFPNRAMRITTKSR